MTDSQRTTGDVGIHYSSASSIGRTRLGYEVMRDTYLALRCDKFLGNGRSNLSAIVEVSKRWDSGACRLLVPSQLLNEPNLSVSIHHRSPASVGQAPTIDASYRLGDEIDFSNPYASRPFMQSGWSLSESWGVWTLGSLAELRLHPTIETDRPLILRAYVFGRRPRSTQRKGGVLWRGHRGMGLRTRSLTQTKMVHGADPAPPSPRGRPRTPHLLRRRQAAVADLPRPIRGYAKPRARLFQVEHLREQLMAHAGDA